jgi:hypothetical protein
MGIQTLDGALDYQRKLIPLVAPPPPFDPLAEPKRTGSSFFPASSVLHPASSNDPARAKKTKEVAVLVVKNFPILNAGDTARSQQVEQDRMRQQRRTWNKIVPIFNLKTEVQKCRSANLEIATWKFRLSDWAVWA